MQRLHYNVLIGKIKKLVSQEEAYQKIIIKVLLVISHPVQPPSRPVWKYIKCKTEIVLCCNPPARLILSLHNTITKHTNGLNNWKRMFAQTN